MIGARKSWSTTRRPRAAWLAGPVVAAVALAACSSSSPAQSSSMSTTGGECMSGDADGVTAGAYSVLVSVSDTAFTVGGVDSGSTLDVISVQNSGTVTLTLTNTGTTPHDLSVECIPSQLPAGCAQTSCFPGVVGGAAPGTVPIVPALQPGDTRTVTFKAPVVEGVYPFISDVPGDAVIAPDGGVSGLYGAFVLM